jgi:hypothetical protein
MSFLESAIKSIGSFLGEGGSPDEVRKGILGGLPTETAPATVENPPLRQPIIESDLITDNGAPEIRDASDFIDDDGSLFIPIDSKPATDKIKDTSFDENGAVMDLMGNRLGVTRTKGQALKSYIEGLKKRENPNNKGLTVIGGQKKFMPFKSIAEKKEPGQSEFEIGYGIKVMDKWLDTREINWPVIDGVPVDIQEGITPQQAESLLVERAKKDREALKSKFKTWDDMTEEEKIGWQDLSYNGGQGAIDKNPKAKAAANAGHTLEGLALLFDYNKAGKNRYRGLFTRRLNVYNKAALSVTGAPVVEEYKWAENEVWVKFSSNIRSDKFSDNFKKKVGKDGWYKVPGPGGKPKNGKVGENFQFS